MKKYWSIVSLMAAMAVSAAGAVGTPAGTKIVNEATLTFSDDTGNNEKTVTSPPVTTTVKAVPSFVLTKNDESPDVTKPDYTKPGQTNTAAKPGDTIVFPYVLTNTGNVPQESYTLGNLPDPTGVVKPGTDVRYYLTNPDTDGNGVVSPAELVTAGAGITSLSGLDPDKAINFFQIYTVPADATSADKYGADPTGTRNPNVPFDNGATITLPIDANNSNTASVVRNDGGVIGPKTDPTAAGGAPAYQTGDTTPVTVTPDKDGRDTQTANATTTTTVITFTNTIQNNGNRPDTFTVTATPQDFPAGTTVELLNPDGTPFVKTPSTDPTKTTDILVRVTLPAGSVATDPTKKPTVNLEVTSGNDPTKKDPTRDIVNLPGLKFGDLTPPGSENPDATPPTPATPATPDPKDPTAVSVDPATCVVSTNAFLSMGVRNLGTLPDRFVIQGSTTITLSSGATTPVNVVYYTDTNANGKLDAGEPKLADVAGGQDVGTLAPNQLVKLVAVIAVPCDSAQGSYTIKQSVKSVDPTDPTKPGTGVAGVDENDTVKVGGNGQVPTVTKAVDLAEAKPGDVLTYTIVGANKTNNNVTKAIVKDVIPANTTYSALSATTTSTGKVLYSNDGTVWNAAAPATATTVYVGVDTNNDGNITVADVLKPGETINVTLKVKVN